MRIALKHLLPRLCGSMLALGISLLSAACVGDSRDSGVASPAGEQTAYISLSLNTGEIGSQTDPSAGNNPASGDVSDQMVDAVRVVLYGPDETVHFTFDFSIKSSPVSGGADFVEGDKVDPLYGQDLYSSSGAVDGTTGFVTFARKIVKGDYKMLVIINGDGGGGTSIYDITNEGQSMSLLYEPVRCDKADFFPSAQNGAGASIMMTNYQDLIEVGAKQLGGTIQKANQNPVYARVERCLAKIVVTTTSEDGTIELRDEMADGEISPDGMSWAVDGSNKWFYWMRRPAPMIGKDGAKGNAETVNYDPAVPVVRETRLRAYAIDPNFDNLSVVKGGTSKQRRDQFNYIIHDSSFSEFSLGYSFGDGEYVLENTMEADEQHPEVMTKAVIRLELSPDKNIISAGESYFTFPDNGTSEDVTITPAQMLSYLANADNIPSNLRTGLANAIDNIRVDGQIDLQGAANGEEVPGFELYGLKFYYHGGHYFMVPVRHYGDYEGSVAGGMEYGRYGVVRNNIYTVKIRSVGSPGSPTAGQPAYLAAGIGITPWMKHAREEDLGSEVEWLGTYVTYKYYYETEDGATEYIGTRYQRNMSVGAPVETGAWLNAMKSELHSPSTYGDGELLSPPPATVSADPASNVVEIIYKPSIAGGSFIVYHIEKGFGIIPGIPVAAATPVSEPERLNPGSASVSQLAKTIDYFRFADLAATGVDSGGEVVFGAEITDFDAPMSPGPGETIIVIICYERS